MGKTTECLINFRKQLSEKKNQKQKHTEAFEFNRREISERNRSLQA